MCRLKVSLRVAVVLSMLVNGNWCAGGRPGTAQDNSSPRPAEPQDGSASRAATSNSVLVSSFETAEDMVRLRPFSASTLVEQSAEHPSEGEHSLRVTIRSAVPGSGGVRMSLLDSHGKGADWSAARSLRIDVYNPFRPGRPKGHNRSSARLDVSLKDTHGNTWWHRWALSPWTSQQVLEVPLVLTLDRMSDSPAPFDFAAVASVTVYTKRPDEDLVLLLDNVRLVPKERVDSAAPDGPLPPAPGGVPSSLGREFTFTQFYGGPGYPYAEKGFFRLGKGPVVLRLDQPGYPTMGVPLAELLNQASELRQREIPFQVILFNFWGGRHETFQEATTRLRQAVAAIHAAGGERLQAVWLHELAAVTHYRVVTEKTERLQKAASYVGFLRDFIRSIQIPAGVLLIANQDRMVNFGLDFEAGVDAVLPETLFELDNVALCMAQARGAAWSFGRSWGGDTARYTGNTLTAAYNRDGSSKPVMIDFNWWRVSDVHKAFIHHYYSGADLLRGQSEGPNRHPEDGVMFDLFLRFVEKHPRAERTVRRIAVVRGKGDYWGGANLVAKPTGLAEWHATTDVEADFLYLNAFLPGFSDDGYTAKALWTGTPLGPIDVVYPAIPLEAMRDYSLLVFLGFHRMDSVRGDFLADLVRYVEGGGTVLLAADPLRNSDERFAPDAELRKLIGAQIADRKRPLASPIHTAPGQGLRLSQSVYPLTAGHDAPMAYEVVTTTATPIAKDSAGVPLLIENRRGRGAVLLLTAPSLAALLPAGNSPLLHDLLRQAALRAPYPVALSPASDSIEFTLGSSANGPAVVFLMNHQRQPWAGHVTLDLAAAGIAPGGRGGVAPRVTAVVCRGYESQEVEPAVSQRDNVLRIGNLALPGATDDFDPYRAASFAVITIDGKQNLSP